ncbi:DNA polymerase III subunit gamma/tau [Halalkalibacterium halodurans]|uniref:DNA polymerase III subunit gamma/tau n=1 Tax=Halalkalibacterium halodurans TaxID=86665 RepID=UPI002E24D41F|nr:DNA polymerase III subunit gamma/tau [Halalkalibacterium halodurans]
MSYQALYRVWRPQKLQDVVGQEHITKTLQNALVQEKFSHAYLFSGPRGTGKTSAAKIIAKAINCEQAPIAEPCNECRACKGITSGSIVDVMEIDAASNNGVDEIRDIRDHVKFAPSEVRYKVYIIDEVHMLTTGAFNALLKTLEEPPSHAIFILATTEPHKIPLTIISRCQRFDFKCISNDALVGRMKEILTHEGIEAEDEALVLVARAAEGGMRDSLSLLDQAISFADERVTVEDVLAITGAVSHEVLTQVVESAQKGETAEALQLVNQLLANGKDPLRFVEDLIYYYRDLMLFKAAPEASQLLERAQINDSFKTLAGEINDASLFAAIEILNDCQQRMRWSSHPRVALELGVVTLCQQVVQVPASPQAGAATHPNVEALQERIQQLEQAVQSLKVNGVASVTAEEPKSKQASRRPLKQMPKSQAPTGKIKELLKEASKQQLQLVNGRWGEVMERVKAQNVPAHAWLMDCKPAAASPKFILLAFQNEMHRDMIDTKFRPFIESVLRDIFQAPLDFQTLLQSQWNKVKEEYVRDQRGDGEEPSSDPLIEEAIKLVGSDLIEVKD